MLRTQAEKNKATGRETGAATFSMMTLEKMTLGITMKKNMTLATTWRNYGHTIQKYTRHNDIQHYDTRC